jgi:hypothetical protein
MTLPDLSSLKARLALGLFATLVLMLLYLAVYYGGYRNGHAKAEALGQARYARLEAAQAQANRLASDAARRVAEAEVIRRDELERSLSAARATIAAQGRKITKGRIADASRDVAADSGRCLYGPEWVGMWNEAWGFGNGDPAGSAAASGAAGGAAGVPAAQAGEFRQGGVTGEDIQVTNRDNAIACRDIKARYLALRRWALGLPKTVTKEVRP